MKVAFLIEIISSNRNEKVEGRKSLKKNEKKKVNNISNNRFCSTPEFQMRKSDVGTSDVGNVT